MLTNRVGIVGKDPTVSRFTAAMNGIFTARKFAESPFDWLQSTQLYNSYTICGWLEKI
jgi:hypothetical protein